MTTQVAGPAFGLLETFLRDTQRGHAGPADHQHRHLPWLQATQTAQRVRGATSAASTSPRT